MSEQADGPIDGFAVAAARQPATDATELVKLADDCDLYAKIIEGIWVVDDEKTGANERKEPATTLAKASAALRLIAQQDGRWHPIETAPKDGTRMLGTDGQCVEVIFWADTCWFNQSAEISMWRAFPPTYWRPLPAPPPALASVEDK